MLEGARLPFITHTCHHHYADQRSLDLPGLLHVVDCPYYICLILSLLPVSIIVVMSFCSSRPDPVLVLFDVHFPLNVHSLYLLLISSVGPYSDMKCDLIILK